MSDIDPRLVGPTIAALQALLALREAELAALKEDSEKRIIEGLRSVPRMVVDDDAA